MSNTEMIYLDYAGSGLVRPTVAARYVDYCSRYSINPHGGTKQAESCRRAILSAERRLLHCLGIGEEQASVIWTSGGTEAINLGIRGLQAPELQAVALDGRAHPAMREAARARCQQGGRLNSVLRLQWKEALVERPALVCVCHVNNETGQIADLKKLRELAGEESLLMVDAAQSFARIPIPWQEAKIDLLAVSSRKIGGPSAVGALIVRRGLTLHPLVYGGGQQGGIRSGTVDAIGAVMFADAAEEACQERVQAHETVQTLAEQLWQGLQERFGNILRRLSPPDAYPGIASFSLPGYEGAVLKRLLADSYDIVIGTGSACSAETGETSQVLKDMGADEKTARGALRVSFSDKTTPQEMERFLDCLRQVLETY